MSSAGAHEESEKVKSQIASEQEAADIARAIQESNADRLQDMLALLQLTRQACRAIPVLEEAWKAMGNVDWEVRPFGPKGALLLARLSEYELTELEAYAVTNPLHNHHVLVRERDIDTVKSALRSIPNKERAHVQERSFENAGTQATCGESDAEKVPGCPSMHIAQAGRAFGADAMSQADPVHTAALLTEQPYTVVRTFVFAIGPRLASEASDVPQSAPCGTVASQQPPNPRRWG